MLKTRKKPLVSIGLPVYNGEDYLEDAIKSILEQSFSDFELIIGDNFSNDDTERICTKYVDLDCRVKYFRHSKNYGINFNFKYVLDKSIGKYFMWSAFDDLPENNLLSHLVSVLEQSNEIILVTSDIQNIDYKGDSINIQKLENIRIEKAVRYKLLNTIYFFRNPTSSINHAFYGLYRRDLMKNTELNYKNKLISITGMEIPYLAQISLKGVICSVPFVLRKYRRHGKSYYHLENDNKKLNYYFSNSLNISFTLLKIILNTRVRGINKLLILGIILIDIVLNILRFFLKSVFNFLLKLKLKS